LILIEDNINKVVGKGILNKSLVELQKEFNDKFKEILVFKDNPTSDDYHEKYTELKDLDAKIDNIPMG